MLKYIDKFLKYLKTDRNTFVTYILTLISLYIVVDRFVELLLMIFSGISVSYWGPIKYTFAMACPVFAFYFSFASKFVKSGKIKLTFVYLYLTALYIVVLSMVVQWINQIGWLALISVPNYENLVTNFFDLIRPAFTSIAIYIPLTTFYPLIKFMYVKIQDTKDIRDSIGDYGGIDLSDQNEGLGPYTCEVAICKDKDTGKVVKIPEPRRFESMLVVGVSGTGKTTMVFEPMIARDIERKLFLKEMSKEMGYTALKTGIATLNCPYDVDYINKNFSLNMLTPNPAKEKIYKAYMKNLIYNYSEDEIVYKNLGITYLAPDYESVKNIKAVAKNFHIHVNIIDPNDQSSVGLNPFTYDNPIKAAIVISSVLKGMYGLTHLDMDEAFRENTTIQALENVAMLLKEMYPRLNDGLLPNMEDLLRYLNDFSLVENLCNQLKQNAELAEEYSLQISYFENNFYKNSIGYADTKKFVHAVITQIDNLLRYPGVRGILCKRSNNIDFDKALKNGEVTLVCTRRGDLGAAAHKAFGLFFLLLMQYSVLSRPGNEKTRIPHFLYVDEFADFICKATEPMFTLYRKYRVGTVISSQNLSQLEGDNKDANFKQTITANCATKMVFGNNDPKDNEWWEKELGEKREWKNKFDYKTDEKDGKQYSSTLKDIEWAWKANYKAGKVQALKYKNCIYKTKNLKGKNIVGKGAVDFLESKYKEPQTEKIYKFNKYASAIHAEEKEIKKTKFNPKKSEDDSDDSGPIRTDVTDSKYLFDNEDAIIVDLKRGNTN